MSSKKRARSRANRKEDRPSKKYLDITSLGYVSTEREVQVLKEEIERSKSQLRITRMKAEQNETRLRRQITFLMEESESFRTLLKETREETDEEVERLTMSRNEALASLREAEQRCSYLELQQKEPSDEEADSVLLIKKNEYLSDKVENLEENVKKLTQSIAAKDDRLRELEIAVANQPPEKKDPLLSLAPPTIVTELNRARVAHSETQRKLRMQSRKVEELQKELSSLIPINEKANLCKRKLSRLENENSLLRKDILQIRNTKTQWESFHRQLQSAFPNMCSQQTNSPTEQSKPSSPPEVTAILRNFQVLRSSLNNITHDNSSLNQKYEFSQQRIISLQSEISSLQSEIKSKKTEYNDLNQKFKLGDFECQKLISQVGTLKREADSLRSLLNLTTGDTSNKKGSHQVLKISLDAAKEEITTLKNNQNRTKQELHKLQGECTDLNKEKDQILHKFSKLKDALFQSREKAELAEERACKAETLAGKGSYNTETTRILHLQSNPFTEALKSKYQAQIDRLLDEKKHLQKQDEDKSTSFLSFSSPSSDTSASSIDAQKLHTRLKERFKEQIGLFREGVYLLTGLKIDMFSDTDQPRFKIRSMYAENEEDHLMFLWPEKIRRKNDSRVACLDLLETDFAQEASKTDAFLYMTKYKSTPSFLASLTLNLFEKQTFAG